MASEEASRQKVSGGTLRDMWRQQEYSESITKRIQGGTISSIRILSHSQEPSVKTPFGHGKEILSKKRANFLGEKRE